MTDEFREINEPEKEELPSEELAAEIEHSAEELMERFHMDKKLKEELKHNVEDLEHELGVPEAHWTD